ncbi:MAG: hypothetical protein IJE43_19295 [Alphaproteobacteria bacterium]|nr:hypothetical protein [Alphaproteobacteria bacterium]
MYTFTSEKEKFKGVLNTDEVLNLFKDYIEPEILSYKGLKQIIVNDDESGVFNIEPVLT